MAKPTDFVQGTLDLLILKTISLEPKHGWAIAKRIQQASQEALQIQQGSLYRVLAARMRDFGSLALIPSGCRRGKRLEDSQWNQASFPHE